MSGTRSARLTGSDVPDSLPKDEAEMAARESGADNATSQRNSSVYDTTELRSISSFDDAIALATDKFGSVDDAAEFMGTGFEVLDTKRKDALCGIPFVILSMDFNDGEQGPFVSCVVVTKDNRRLILNDGSTGVYAQLDEWFVRTGKGGGLLVNGGLRKSEYKKDLPDGSTTNAVTYYLNV